MRLRVAFVVTPALAGQRLDALVFEPLARALGYAPSKAQVRTLIVAGSVRVDGRSERRAGRPLAAGARVQAEVDRTRLRDRAREEQAAAFQVDARCVVYEDEALIAIDKPAGLALHATADERRPHLVALTLDYLARSTARQAGVAPYLGVHQRLDRETSGVVLFTKDARANAGLARQFEQHTLEKVYHALVVRPRCLPPQVWSASEPVAGAGSPRAAHTDLRLLEVLPGALLIEARPRTGRKHQIRIHLALAGLPILGDLRYGAGTHRATSGAPVARVMLHAARLTLVHPLTGRPLVLESAHPPDFAAALQQARGARGHPGPARPR